MKNILSFLILFFSFQASAIELFQMGQSARSLGMGGTSIAFARGTDAIFNNPAALSKVNGFSLNMITFGPAISTNAQDLVDGFDDDFDQSDVDELYGKKVFSEVTGYGGLVVPYVGVGAYSNNTLLMSFNNPSFPTFNVDFTSDYAYVVGGAIPVTDNFSLGVAGRHVKRWQGRADILVSSLIGSNPEDVIEAQLLNKGKGNALDLAALYTFKGPWTVDLAAVWKDVGDTKFTPTQGDGPDRQENNLIFGAAASKEFGFINWTNAFEYKFIRNTGNVTKKLHLGTEVSLALIDIRAGYNQGYVSYGLGVDLWFLQVDVAAYTAELGATAGQTPNDRYQASVSLNLDFDSNFKLTNANGKRRRLQQRR
ncbi:hypothetical protein [Pseudobdellovibrio sp. HCB154]|uniref:hypothetical protein n=1 Tax=Pseudobdellovibrio sp. HCB154 TaxID=3386277 RepID=UPI003916D461